MVTLKMVTIKLDHFIRIKRSFQDLYQIMCVCVTGGTSEVRGAYVVVSNEYERYDWSTVQHDEHKLRKSSHRISGGSSAPHKQINTRSLHMMDFQAAVLLITGLDVHQNRTSSITSWCVIEASQTERIGAIQTQRRPTKHPEPFILTPNYTTSHTSSGTAIDGTPRCRRDRLAHPHRSLLVDSEIILNPKAKP